MALLTAGYWHTTYWPEDYWADDYWLDYGVSVGAELLTAGYWQTTYWPKGYWQTSNQYWPEYGTAIVARIERNKIVAWYLLEEARTWL